jgi:predicted anti-sigma-YlaC factor YlaD
MVSCKAIIAEISVYLDGDATEEMRQKIEKHLRRCHRCAAVYDSTRKMLVIIGDERVFELQAEFSTGLHAFLGKAISGFRAD